MPTERILGAPRPLPASSGTIAASPFQYYVSGEDGLVLVVWSSRVFTVAVAGRWYHGREGIEVFRETRRTNGNPEVPQAWRLHTSEGYLLNCSIEVVDTLSFTGECFVQLLIGRGEGAAFVKLGTVLQGYVATSKFLGFPGSLLESSLEGPGARNRENMAAVAAGAGWSTGVPPKRRRRVHMLYSTLLTSAAVGNRFVHLKFSPNAIGVVGYVNAVKAQPGGVANAYTWAPAASSYASPSSFITTASLPAPCDIEFPMVLLPLVEGLDVADQWSGQVLEYEEWLITDTVPAAIL